MADLGRATALLEEALAAAGRLVGPAAVAPVADELAAVERRHGFLGPTVVAALAGGTGSGKSSLLNALAGAQVAATGILRPTTDEPTAWVPVDAEPALEQLLDSLSVRRRVTNTVIPDLAVLDLPDLDSVERSHRLTVDALLPRVDLVVWVLDPQKYNDRAIHDLVAGRARYAEQLLFVLNRRDQLSARDLEAVCRDLVATLQQDGIRHPTVLTTAAAPPDGPPRGVEDLADHLRRLARRKELVLDKLAEDLRGIVERLEDAAGAPDTGTDADPAARWQEARDAAAADVAAAVVDAPAVARARRAGARTAVAAGSGPLGRVWHRLRRSPVGRAIGLPQDAPIAPAPVVGAARSRDAERGVSALVRGVHALSVDLGGAVGRRVRAEYGAQRIETDLHGALEGARPAPAAARVAVRAWWRAAAVLQTLLTLAVVVGAVWLWWEPSTVRPGEVPVPVLLVAGGVLLGLLVTRLVRASGAQAGARHAAAHRDRLAAALARGLDERIGASLQDLIRERERLATLLAEARGALNGRRRRRGGRT